MSASRNMNKPAPPSTAAFMNRLARGPKIATARPPSGSGGTTQPPAFARRSLVDGAPATRARSLAAARHLVDGRPGAPLGFRLTDAALFITFFYVLRLAPLLCCIFGFVAARHSALRVNRASIAREQRAGCPVPCRLRVLPQCGQLLPATCTLSGCAVFARTHARR